MEKTIQITIASTTFSLTENAYAALSKYLETLKAHFAGEAESTEIIGDIESRIAEKLLHTKHRVVTETEINAVIAEIGSADEFDDTDAGTQAPKAKPAGRRLYRDMDNAMLAGVASGIGAYFDIDPIWIRLLFLVSIFFGGTGILLYIILWVLIPEAKSASQKLEMRGHPVDLQGIARVVKESVEDASERGVFRKGSDILQRIVSAFFRVIGKVLGALFVVGSFFGAIGLLIGAGIIATNWNAPYNDFPLRGVVAEPLLIAGFIAGFIAILIPLIAVFALGIRLVNRKTVFPSAIAFGLIGIWALALSAGGTIAVKAAGEYYQHRETDPAYAIASTTPQLPSFTAVDAEGTSLTIRTGDTQSVVIEGHESELGRIQTEVKDGTLIISSSPREARVCIFCVRRAPSVIITTPNIDALTLTRGNVSLDDLETNTLTVTSHAGHVRGTIIASSMIFVLENTSVDLDLTSDTLSVTADDTYLALEGTVQTGDFTISDSSMSADSLHLTNATISADDSYGEMYVSGTLETKKNTSSYITNTFERELE